jgi:hypothetical protein
MTIDYLCSFHGSFLYYDESAGCLRCGPSPQRNAALVTEDGVSWLARRVGEDWRRLDALGAGGQIGSAGHDAAPLLFHVRRLADGLLALEANGLSLSADPGGSVSLSRPIQGPTEAFAPLSDGELDWLADIRGQGWISTAGKTIPAGDGIRIQPNFRAQIGELTVPLQALLGARHRRHGDGWPVRYEAWKVERLTAFRPLVYLTAYGRPESFGSLTLALQALQEFGRYDAEILIFSDRSREQISSAIPPGLHRQIRVATAPANDPLDVAAAKYRICDMPELAGYRPLLYLRTEVICNRPLQPLLFELLHADRICLPLEHDLLGEHNLYGANLFAADEAAQKRGVRGASTGVMGLPNIAVARRSFPILLDSLYALSRALGTRQPSPWYDQPVANYVLHKLNELDGGILTPRVTTPVLFDRPLTEIPRNGFAHFSGGVGTADPNLGLMRSYLELLRATL